MDVYEVNGDLIGPMPSASLNFAGLQMLMVYTGAAALFAAVVSQYYFKSLDFFYIL